MAALADAGIQQNRISDWVVTEVSSALSIKRRREAITEKERNAALARFRRTVAQTFTVLAVERSRFALAAGFSDTAELNLRASDALHLAVAQQHGLTVLTLDQDMAEGGARLGIATRLI